jgi:hypothetical protein
MSRVRWRLGLFEQQFGSKRADLAADGVESTRFHSRTGLRLR